jgi:hypothetical protein
MTFYNDFEFQREEFLNVGKENFVESLIIQCLEGQIKPLVQKAMVQELIAIDREEWEAVNKAIPFIASEPEVDVDDLVMVTRKTANYLYTAWVHTLHHHLSDSDDVLLDMDYMPLRDLYTSKLFREFKVAGQPLDLTKPFLSAISILLNTHKRLELPVYMVMQRGKGGYRVARRYCHGEDQGISSSG